MGRGTEIQSPSERTSRACCIATLGLKALYISWEHHECPEEEEKEGSMGDADKLAKVLFEGFPGRTGEQTLKR